MIKSCSLRPIVNVRRTPREGFGVAEQDGVIVAVTTEISMTS